MRGFVTQKRGREGWYPVSLPGNKKKWLRRCSAKREAEKLLALEVAKCQSSGWYPSSSVLFRVFSESWIRTCMDGGRKPSTLHGYRSALQAHLLPAFGDYRLDRITPEVVQTFINRRLKAGMKPATLNRLIRQLHTILEQARRWRYLSENPVGLVERPRLQKRQMEYLRPDEIDIFLEAAPPHRRLLFKTAVLTGLRMGELLAMKWANVDWRSGRYYVVESLWLGKGGFQFVSPKTESSRRAVRLQPGLLAELHAHRELQKQHRLVLGDGYHDFGLIFCQLNGRPLNPNNLLNRDFRKTLQCAGLRRMRFHDLRHTFASFMIAQGEHPKTIQEAMGHSSIGMTMNTYGHLLPRLQEEAADRLEASLFPGSRQAVDGPLTEGEGKGRKPLIDLAGPEGIEPPTRGLGVPCSIH